MKPVDKAVYWIEYVLRNGKVLQPASAQLPFYQLYLLDIVGFVLLIAVVVILLLKKILSVVVNGISKRNRKLKTK